MTKRSRDFHAILYEIDAEKYSEVLNVDAD